MAGHRERLLRPEHARAAAERRLGLLIVEPRVPTGDEEEGFVLHPHRQRLGDPGGLDAERLGGLGDGRRAHPVVDDREVGGMLREPGADGFEAHRKIRPFTLVRTRRIEWPAVMNKVFPSAPPNAQLEMAVPASIRPSSRPSGAKMWIPPGPLAQRLPRASTDIPSGRPGRPFAASAVMSAKVRRERIAPS